MEHFSLISALHGALVPRTLSLDTSSLEGRHWMSQGLTLVNSAFMGGSSQTQKLKRGVVDMLLAVYYATSNRVTPGALSAARQMKLFSFIARRLRSMDSMADANRMIRTLKGACHACRQAGLTGQLDGVRSHVGQITFVRRTILSREYLLQLGMGGRALPAAPEHLVKAAVEKQRLLLSKPAASAGFDVDDSVEQFCRVFRLKPCKDIPCMPSLSSGSASYAYSRREGGRAQEVKDILEEDFIKNLSDVPVGGTTTSRITDKLTRMGEFLSQTGYEMESRSVAISELGYKTRVVSCSDPVRTHQSESYRRQLFKLLKRLPCCAAPLRDDIAVMKMRKFSSSSLFVFSADLSSATDNLNHEVITAFCDALNVPFELVTGGTIDDCTITTGTLMGVPCSWPILSLAHAWACWAMGIPLRSFRLKGDDLIGLWPLDVIQRYQQDIQCFTGMPINLDKSFVSKDRGVFCEKNYLLQSRTLVHTAEVIPLRFLVNRSPETGFPYVLKVRKALWAFRGFVQWRRLAAIGRHWTGVSPRLGGMCYLPTEYGGLEVLPHRFGETASKTVASLASAIHDCTLPREVQEMLRMSWTKALPAGSAERLASVRYSVVELGQALKLGGKLSSHLSSLFDRDRELFSLWAHFVSEPAGSVGYHRYYRVVKRLCKRLEKKTLPRHSRLKSWTVQGVRQLVASLKLDSSFATKEVTPEAIRRMADGRTSLAFTQ
uniref:RNA-dependent RNA polymerase n=1 Tax=Plasmopara viticola lesion associated narnavirus 16 TaxID=2719499 RepID=A0A6G9RTR4_9VIRU|nr:RNA-dependent RNA polymerase [Plasmopara viticola lesion associated narnavirus 16]